MTTLHLRAPAIRAALGGTATSFAVLMLAASGAWAQEGGSMETVTVTGLRASITASLDIKQKSQNIVEAISAEDIGKLPESSIADSLARLPGLASQRSNNGHWQDISVNGLPPSMSATLFNGRPQASTDNNRVIQFDQYPAELMSAVKVYKSGDAALVNGAIATVDLNTIRPLDYDKTTIVIGGQGEYGIRGSLQPGANPLGGRVNVSYVDQFANNTLGVMVGFATMSSPNQIYAQHPYDFNQPNDVVTGLQDQVRSDTLARTGVISTIQWKPTNNLQVTLDGFYSFYDDFTIIRGVEAQTACCGNATAVGTPTPGVSSWIVKPQILNYHYDNRSKQYSFGGTVDYAIGLWSIRGDFGFSEADRNDARIELYSGFGTNGSQNTSTVTLTAGAGESGMIGISNWSLQLANNPAIALGENLTWQQGWWPPTWPNGGVTGDFSTCGGNFGSCYGSAYNQHILSDDIIRDTTWSLKRELGGFFSDIEVGFGYTARSKNYIDHEGIGALKSQNEAMAIPADWLLKPTKMSVFGLPDMPSIDVKKAWASGQYIYLEKGDELSNNWLIKEKVWAPYFISRIDSQMFGRTLTGNVGVQFVHTDQEVSGLNKNNVGPNWWDNNFTPYKVSAEYWDILPSLNLTLQLTDDKQIRLGAGRSIARPRFDSMGGGSSVTFDHNASAFPWKGSVGNPKLKPWRSDDVDVTYEWYYAPGEALFVEGFYKNLETFIYNKTTILDFHPYANLAAGYTVNQWYGAISSFDNANGGSLEGVVVGGNFLLSHISSWLDGFGIQAQATLLSSSVHIPDKNTSPTGEIPELSKFSGNISFYYEVDNFSFRINDRYRSKYVQEVPNFDGSLQSIEGASENTVDVQVSYTWDKLTFSFAGQNLTDTPMNSYLAGNTHHPEYYKLFGTNLLFGVSYKY